MNNSCRKWALAAAVAALIAVPGMARADIKAAVTLNAGLGPDFRAGEILNRAILSGASDSSRVIKTLGYKQLWAQIFVRGFAAANQMTPYRIAFQAREVACWDSAGAAGYLLGYPNADTTQSIKRRMYAADTIAAPALTLGDTLCLNPFMFSGIRMSFAGSGGISAPTDTAYIGSTDTTFINTTRVWPNELLIEMPPRRANQGTTAQLLMQPAIYYFPLTNANGVFFQANYASFRFRNLGPANIVVRFRLVMFRN